MSPVGWPWTSLTDLKSSRSARISPTVPPSRSARASSVASISSAWRRFASPVSPSTSAWRSTIRCSRAFSSATTACLASAAPVIRCSVSNRSPTSDQAAEAAPTRCELELEPLAARAHVAGLHEGAVVGDDHAAPRLGRLDSRLDDHAAQLLLVEGVGERVAEARIRLSQAASLLLEIVQARLELRGHLVEGPTELRELVASLDRHPLTKAAGCD